MPEPADARIVTFSHYAHHSDDIHLPLQLMFELLRQHYRISSIDMAPDVTGVTSFIEKRRQIEHEQQISLLTPSHLTLSIYQDGANFARDEPLFFSTIQKAAIDNHFIFIHTSCHTNPISTLVHAYAHYVVTPIPYDIPLIEQLKSLTLETIAKIEVTDPYLVLIQNVMKQRLSLCAELPKWFFVITPTDSTSPGEPYYEETSLLSFIYAPKSRACYASLFNQSLSLADTLSTSSSVKDHISYVAARQELRQLLQQLGITKQKQPMHL